MMPLTVTWADLVVRLLSTLIAGAVLGYNRGEHGKAAGLRTTMLVCVAAALATLQMNYLLPLAGRAPDSFVMNDLMRLPLGILTGVGFIGGGAILRRGDIVTGVTTAATLWYATVLGLCFGGGQLLLGWIGTAIGCLVLWGLTWLEASMTVQVRARLTVTLDADGPAENDIRGRLQGCGAHGQGATAFNTEGQRRTYVFEVAELRPQTATHVPALLNTLGQMTGLSSIQWQPIG